jgi:hypothetical protein
MIYFYNDGSGNEDWSNTANWWSASSGGGSNVPVPTGGEDITIETACSVNVPANLDYNIYLYANLTLPNDAVLFSTRTMSIESGVNLTILNLLTIIGTLNINTSWSSGPVAVNAGGIVSNSGDWYCTSITNNGTVNVGAGSLTLATNSSNLSSGVINTVGTGQFEIVAGTTFTNDGSLILNSSLNFIRGTLINNSSVVVGQSTDLAMRPAAVITNNGTFTYGNIYSTKFKGRIFPQVPSSASWGNVFL